MHSVFFSALAQHNGACPPGLACLTSPKDLYPHPSRATNPKLKPAAGKRLSFFFVFFFLSPKQRRRQEERQTETNETDRESEGVTDRPRERGRKRGR